MVKKNWLRMMILLSALACLMSVSAVAQRSEREERGLACNDNWNGNHASHCVIKEQTINATGGKLDIDGNKNGGIAVKGWDRNEILIRAKIQTWADTDAEARGLADQIRIETGGGRIQAAGPDQGNHRGWATSFEISVPRNSSLSLKTHNGGISISDVRGEIDFSALNGGVSLKRLSGDVKGQTTNGGLSIELAGDRWDGAGMNVRTTNGGVNMHIPENYSAHLETGTINGGMNVNIPITVTGKIERDLSVDLGSGGTTIRATTTNGGVTIRR